MGARVLSMGAWGSQGAYKKWQGRHLALPSFQGPIEPVRPLTPDLLETSEAEPEWDVERVVADTGGAIAELVLHYSGDDDVMLAPVFQDLFTKLPRDVALKVFCPSQEGIDHFENRWGSQARSGGRETTLFDLGRTLSLWPRDRRIARQTDEGLAARSFIPTPLAGYEEDKRNDLLITSILWPLGQLPGSMLVSFQLEGGNVVSNQRHLFTGINVLNENNDKFQAEHELVAALQEVFGLSPILIQDRDGSVPWDHADMYLTPVNENLVFLADVMEGLRLYTSDATQSRESSSSATPLPWEAPDVLPTPEKVSSLEDVATQLAAEGYEVRRQPALMYGQNEWMITYNNVLMDHRDGRDIVYLPVYGHPLLDHTAIQRYQDVGFEVRTIDVSRIYHMGGAIRCLANVTRRHPRPSSANAEQPAFPATLSQIKAAGEP